MFDIGPGELLLVAIIGLLVLGPQRLPKVAAELGKWVGRARRTATQLRRRDRDPARVSAGSRSARPPDFADASARNSCCRWFRDERGGMDRQCTSVPATISRPTGSPCRCRKYSSVAASVIV